MNVTTPRHSVGRERLRLFVRNPMGMFGFILVSLYFEFNLSAALMEGVWLLVSLYGLWRALRPAKA